MLQVIEVGKTVESSFFVFGRKSITVDCHVVSKRLENKYFATSDLVRDGLCNLPDWMHRRILGGFIAATYTNHSNISYFNA